MNLHSKQYGQGLPLVFFHGWGFDHQIWLPLLPYLQDHYQLILVDLPGFGLTPMMDWPTFKANLLEQLPPQFVLLGWSLGGLYATRFAIEEPQRVRCLLNINTSPCFVEADPWPGVNKEVFLSFYKNLSKDANKTLHEFVALTRGKTREKLFLGQAPTQEGLASGFHMLGSWDLREEIKSISLPTYYMFGRLDPIVPVNTMSIMQSLYPNFSYLLFNKAAHIPFLSHTEIFVEKFLGCID